jgi:hypothetical protein
MAVFTPATASQLQSDLDTAAPGDEILLTEKTVYEGNFVLCEQPASGSPIVIRTNLPDAALPLPDQRITPASASRLAKLVTANTQPALRTDPGARGYLLLGLELTVSPEVRSRGITIVAFGSDTQDALDSVPADLRMDRCYVHGNPEQDVRRGLALNSADTTIVNCYLADFHLACIARSGGAEAQAIAGWNGPGPFTIENCFLEGGDQNVLFGGAQPSIPNLVPSDITFRGNHCRKPLSWRPGDPAYAGHDWRVKNLFELKNARHVVIEGNVFEQNWGNGDQKAFAIVFTPRNQVDDACGTADWTVVEDVWFHHNIVRHSGQGINILGRDDSCPTASTNGIRIEQNLFADIDGATWGQLVPLVAVPGRWLQLLGGPGAGDYTVDRNTAIQSGAVLFADGDPMTGLVFTNTIAPHNDDGVAGTGTGSGLDTLDTYFPGWNFCRNIIAGANPATYPDPTDNFYPASLVDVGFVDLPGQDYRLDVSSPYKGKGDGGTDPGCDVGAVEAMTAGVI